MRDTEILAALFETTRTLGLSDSLDSLLDLILERARDLTGFDHCALMLVDPDTSELVVRRVAGYGERHADVEELRLAAGEGLTGWAVEHRRPIRVGDVREDGRYVPGLKNARSNLVVPLILENEVAGVLNVESGRVDAFDERDEKVLTVLGTQAALAILAAQARSSLERRINQLDALYQISGLAWGDRPLEELTRQVVTAIARVVPSSSNALLLLHPTEDALVLVAQEGYDEDVTGMKIPLEEGITGRCACTGEIQVVPDVREDPDYIQGVAGARCEVALPLEVEGRVIGVLDVESPEIESIAEDQIRTLSMIARQIAAVVETARLQEERLQLAFTDPLTEIANRRFFEERLEKARRGAERTGGHLSLLILDLDHFKKINDEHGHEAGDEVLRQLARTLDELVRQDDTLARIGGEEFAVIAPGAGPGPARKLAERLRRAVEAREIELPDGTGVSITTSVGLAHVRGAADPESPGLFKRADQALYRAKEQGRNRIVMAD